MPNIFVESVGAYNAGQSVGRWVDCSIGESFIADNIEDVIELGQGDEWFVIDYEGWGDYKVSENPNIDELTEIAGYIEQYGEEVYGAYAQLCYEQGWRFDEFDHHFVGEYESKGQYAREWFESVYSEDGLGPLVDYIEDWDWVYDGELSNDTVYAKLSHSRYVFFSYD